MKTLVFSLRSGDTIARIKTSLSDDFFDKEPPTAFPDSNAIDAKLVSYHYIDDFKVRTFKIISAFDITCNEVLYKIIDDIVDSDPLASIQTYSSLDYGTDLEVITVTVIDRVLAAPLEEESIPDIESIIEIY